MAFLSLIPAVGSAIVWVPAAIYLFSTQQLWQGFFIVGFFVVVVGLVDNILRPILVGKDTKMPDYLILITTVGRNGDLWHQWFRHWSTRCRAVYRLLEHSFRARSRGEYRRTR
ncbi:putative inner membrane protein [Citrobacter amalonaticus]|nr:putative inner membrane protein [Citrobacter amalonaticus]